MVGVWLVPRPLVQSRCIEWLQQQLTDLYNLVFQRKPIGVTFQLEDKIRRYSALHKAAMKGDWVTAEKILSKDSEALKERINILGGTAFHVAVGTNKAIHFLQKLADRMPPEDSSSLEQLDAFGRTPLSIAAAVDNIEAAKILVNKRKNLLYITSTSKDYPVHTAARYGHREMLFYLLSAMEVNHDLERNQFDAQHRLRLLTYVIDVGFIDVAINMVNKEPELAKLKLTDNNTTALKKIAEKKSLFSRRIISRQKKQEARNFVKLLCKTIDTLACREAATFFIDAAVVAVKEEVHDVLELIVEAFPSVIYCCAADAYDNFLTSFAPGRLFYDFQNSHSIFHIAVQSRSADVFNYIRHMSDPKDAFLGAKNSESNNLLHLAAEMSPSHKLNGISGAALQMQHELQWYKAVESVVHPNHRNEENKDGKTPKVLFTEAHKGLKADGEKWVKDTANSCIVAAVLIATVMFTAAITVPGGNSTSGFPSFSKDKIFILFAISDAASLFTSTTSLLMFLSIVTSRYAEEDFLYILPRRLIIGLGALILSITFMMLSFAATVYLVLGQKKAWVLIPVAAFSCLPVASFVFVQFFLFRDMIFSTYFSKIY